MNIHYTAEELAKLLGISRPALEKAVKSGRVLSHDNLTGSVRGWSKKRTEAILKSFVKGGK